MSVFSKVTLIGVILATALGGIALHAWRQPEITPAMRGEAVARRAGCFGCHGEGGLVRVADPASSSGTVPGWDSGTVAMYVKSESDIREWIVYGAPRDRAPRLDSDRPETLTSMPAYGDLLSDGEVDDLVAYFIAVSGWGPGISEVAHEGRRIAERLGCFSCHGPSGMGGVLNPGSFTGRIPAWDGEEFEELVRDEAELREWIMDGRIRRLWEDPRARHFLDRQIIQMPGYRDYLSDDELDKLVAYVEWLKDR